MTQKTWLSERGGSIFQGASMLDHAPQDPGFLLLDDIIKNAGE